MVTSEKKPDSNNSDSEWNARWWQQVGTIKGPTHSMLHLKLANNNGVRAFTLAAAMRTDPDMFPCRWKRLSLGQGSPLIRLGKSCRDDCEPSYSRYANEAFSELRDSSFPYRHNEI
ncbi:hypothetical protein ZHAS_00021198 [Anopheles sinensis]|uniref:Uncharacterized protein n=1 Tax=Anopheles sinensis TaxID=74873 RepID=A0A084WRS2_ANOSI|nr:hypothetical protein ZHAS_00021198 [Anopheles sinensis]